MLTKPHPWGIQIYHIIPSCDDGLHVKVTREEGHDTIRYNLAVLDEDASKVAHDGRIVPYFKTRTDGDLITTSRDDLLLLIHKMYIEVSVRTH